MGLKAMLHEAIFLATCNAINVALQVARENSRVTPHFATAIVALRVARKVQCCETSCMRVTSPQQLAAQFCQNGPIRGHLLLAGDFKMRPPSCLLLYAAQVAKKVATV